MSEHQKQTIIRWFAEVWNKGRRQAIDEMLPPNCVIHGGGTSLKGPDWFNKYFDLYAVCVFGDSVDAEEVISEGGAGLPAIVGKVASHWRWFGYAGDRQESRDHLPQPGSFHRRPLRRTWAREDSPESQALLN